MLSNVKRLLFITFVILFSLNVYGETFKNKATVNYKKFSGSKKQEVIDQAVKEACLKSVRTYVNSFDDARYENYLKVKDKIVNNLFEYVNCTLIDGNRDKKAKTYTAAVKAEILLRAFNAAINQSSAIKDADSAEKSEVVFVFFAREVDEAKLLKTKEYNRADTSSSESVSEIAATDGQETIVSGSAETSTTSTTGGSSVIKSDELVYSPAYYATDAVTYAMNEFFTKANYDLSDIYAMGDDAADLYEAMLEEFGSEGTPSRRSLSKLNRILQDENIGFFVYGTLTLGQKEIDQSTGNVVSAASISGAVYDLTGKRAKVISSISPQVVKGFGSTQEISKEMALSNSSKQSADILINILNNRGIQ